MARIPSSDTSAAAIPSETFNERRVSGASGAPRYHFSLSCGGGVGVEEIYRVARERPWGLRLMNKLYARRRRHW
jgi:hypothetical protein